jgi:hypothetical protein
MDSSFGSFDLDGPRDAGCAAYCFTLDWRADEGDSGECGERVHVGRGEGAGGGGGSSGGEAWLSGLSTALQAPPDRLGAGDLFDMDYSSCGFDRARSRPTKITEGAKKAAYYPKTRCSPQN